MSLLPITRVQDLASTFIALGLDVDRIRVALLAGLPAAFRAGLVGGLPPNAQVMADLHAMNDFERLADGTVPLQIWLSNAITLAMGSEAERTFRLALDDVSYVASGAPRLQVEPLPEIQQAIVHRDDLLPYAFFEQGIAAARSVTKLRVPTLVNGAPRLLGATPEVHLGTGWLLAPTLLMTNHHVVQARKEAEPPASQADLRSQAATTQVQFDFDSEGAEGHTVQAQTLEAWDATLDYALLRLPSSGRAPLRRKAGRIELSDGEPVAVNIIQHPEGRSKQLGVRNNLVTASSGNDLRYFTDTKAGSSGAPVFTDTWEVAALHRGATFAENVSFQGKNVAYLNVGTHLDRILDDLVARFPHLANEITQSP